MMKCPIASQLPHRAEAKALSSLTYKELDELIGKVAYPLKDLSSPVIASIPKGEILDIALFFAAWRLGKSIYPLSFRLPRMEIERRLQKTHATLIEPKLGREKLEQKEIDPNLIATYLETSSGTKIACHTFAAHLVSAHSANAALKIDATSHYGLILPLFHIAGVAAMLRTFVAGGELLLKDQITQATHLSIVSTQLYRFVKDKAIFPKLKCMLVGGGPFPQNLEGAPYPIVKSYGMTEAASLIAQDGKILDHIDCKIVDGQIWIQGPSLFSHYLNEAKRQGWFSTGNTGYWEGESLVVSGRSDRVFISGGEKIQPEAIEKTLLTLPGVLDAQVFSQEDNEFGQVPFAKIATNRKIEDDEIKTLLEKAHPRFHWPKKIEQVPSLDSKLSKLL